MHGFEPHYFAKKIAEDFVPAFAKIASEIKVGDLSDPETAIGPIISDKQVERVKFHISDAISKGASVIHGGIDWVGNCCPPTILSDVSEGMTIFREETFGPVTSIYTVDDLDEAIKVANDTQYGLSCSVLHLIFPQR